MRRLTVFAVLTLLAVLVAGCSTDSAFVKASRDHFEFAKQGYVKYVIEGNPAPKWTDSEKADLLKTFDDYEALLKKKED